MKKSMQLMAAAGTMMAAGAALAQVNNGSFETPGQFSLFDSWGNFGNAFAETVDVPARTGVFSVKMFGNFNGPFNATGVFQDIPATPGQTWRGSVWVYNRTPDAMQGGNFAAFNLEYRNFIGGLINYSSAYAANVNTPRDQWLEVKVNGITPPGTAFVRVVPIFLQAANESGAIFFDDAEAAPVSQPELINPSFEITNQVFDITEWTRFDNAFQFTDYGYTGYRALRVGVNNTGPNNASGAFQSLAASEGQNWTATAWVQNPAIDPLQGDNFAALNIEWIDSNEQLISFSTVNAATSSTTVGAWQQVSVTGAAPAGTAKAKVVALVIQPTTALGSILFDDITLSVATGPVCDSIDFNNDASVFDPTDIDAFLSVFSEGPCIPAEATCNDIDFNNDGSLFDPQDIDSFLSVFSEGPCF
jgi:hypothetical protein